MNDQQLINDQLMITNTGVVQRIYETELNGITELQTKIDREELLDLVQWIAENGFFEFNNEYECVDSDEACLKRMEETSQIPLKVVVAIGPYRNVVNVPLFSLERNDKHVPYPDSLRKIVKAIYEFASL